MRGGENDVSCEGRGALGQEISAMTSLVSLRNHMATLWPLGNQANTLKRELAFLLLEDPAHRLRLAHCEEIMRTRLPGVYTQSPPTGYSSHIQAALNQDSSCHLIFHVEHPGPVAIPTGISTAAATASSGESNDWSQMVLRLDSAELSRSCGFGQLLGQPPTGLPFKLPIAAAAGVNWGKEDTIASHHMPVAAAPYLSSFPSPTEHALLLSICATWPQSAIEDEGLLVTALGFILACHLDPQGSLPPCSLYLADVMDGLRGLITHDSRLSEVSSNLLGAQGISASMPPPPPASTPPPSAPAPPPPPPPSNTPPPPPGGSKKTPAGAKGVGGQCLQEFLSRPRIKGLLKLRDGASGGAVGKRGERVVVLCVDRLSPPTSAAELSPPVIHWLQVEQQQRWQFEMGPWGPYENNSCSLSGGGGLMPPAMYVCSPPPMGPGPLSMGLVGPGYPGLPKFLFEYEAPDSYGASGNILNSPVARWPVVSGSILNSPVARWPPPQVAESGGAQGASEPHGGGVGGPSVWPRPVPIATPATAATAAAADQITDHSSDMGISTAFGSLHPLSPNPVIHAASLGAPPSTETGRTSGIPPLAPRGQASAHAKGNGTQGSVAVPRGASSSPPGHTSLFSSSPSVIDSYMAMVPREVASCWGEAAAAGQRCIAGGRDKTGSFGGRTSSHHHPIASSHGQNNGGSGSPPSSLDATSALMGGSNSSSVCHSGMDVAFWPSSSPEVCNVQGGYSDCSGTGGMTVGTDRSSKRQQQSWLPMHCSDGMSFSHGQGGASVFESLPSNVSTTAGGGGSGLGGNGCPSYHNGDHTLNPSQQYTPSSVSEVSEDCGVHGPLDLETALEAIISFDDGSCLLPDPSVSHPQFEQQRHVGLNQMKTHGPGVGAAGQGERSSPHMGGVETKSFAAAAAAGSHIHLLPSPLTLKCTNAAGTMAAPPHSEVSSSSSNAHSKSSSSSAFQGQGQPGQGGQGLKIITGWAAVAAKGPPTIASALETPLPGTAVAAAAAFRQNQRAPGPPPPYDNNNGNCAGSYASNFTHPAPPVPGSSASLSSSSHAPPRMFLKVSSKLREEILRLVSTVPGLKAEDFDEGVLYQLGQKQGEDEAVAALRTLLGSDVSSLQHPAAYLNHVIKNYHLTGGSGGDQGAGGGTGSSVSLPSATVRANSVPISAKAMLQRLPLRVYRRLEEIVNRCNHLEWKHFDAGVIKVLGQLAELSDDDVAEELELLQSSDLSAVEYMPAYLNKRLNNRLWSKRKQQQCRQQQQQ